jgi:hypothetical protein
MNFESSTIVSFVILAALLCVFVCLYMLNGRLRRLGLANPHARAPALRSFDFVARWEFYLICVLTISGVGLVKLLISLK